MQANCLDISNGLPRLTLAVGLFDRAVAIHSALRDLAAHDFSLGNIAVFAAARTEELGRVANWVTDVVGDHRQRLHRVDANSSVGALSAIYTGAQNSGGVSGGSENANPSPRNSDQYPEHVLSWVFERQSRRLGEHLRDGGSVLVVPILEAKDQPVVCSILLHYASGSVQTHQIRGNAPRPALAIDPHGGAEHAR
ncbi:MAG: hypothetical protein KDJ37_15685 [Hyphomicrobiaceae bacterium]|nr:hypothetical protein [Hyphomicrobiaceae bacterium]